MTLLHGLAKIVATESVDGRAILENPRNNPVCTLSLDEEVRCISVVWRKYATSAQLRFIHEVLIEMIQQYGIRKILGDDTDLPVVHAEDQRWIIRDWVPRAEAAGLRAVAATTSLSFFGMLSISNIHSQLPDSIAIKQFSNIIAARKWLSRYSEY